MKKFASHKPSAIIRKQCRAQGLIFDDKEYRRGSDHIVVRSRVKPGEPQAYASYNTTTGRFIGRTDKGILFNSDETQHEAEPWFQAVLSFFYVEKATA